MANSKKEERYPFNLYGFKTEIPAKYYLLVYIINVVLIAAMVLGITYFLRKSALPVAGVGVTGRGIYKTVGKYIEAKQSRAP